MLIEHNIFECWCLSSTLLQQSLGRRRLPFHFVKVNVATRVHNIIAAHEIDMSIRPENYGVSAMEFDSFDEDLLRVLDNFLNFLMLRFIDPISLLLLFFGQEGLPQFIDAVLARKYVAFVCR